MARVPENFSWIEEGVLAGSAIPWLPQHFQYYVEHNIHTLVTLTEFKPPMHNAPDDIHLDNIFMPVIEFEPPSIEQVKDFIGIVNKAKEKREAVCVHCHWGRGRTGVMLAAYLVYMNSRSTDQADKRLYPRKAIAKVRTMRPHSIETPEQEDIIWKYSEIVLKENEHLIS